MSLKILHIFNMMTASTKLNNIQK